MDKPQVPVGLQRPVTGALLRRVVNFSGPIGVAYERTVGYEKDIHHHDRFTLAFARGSSRVAFDFVDGPLSLVAEAGRCVLVHLTSVLLVVD